MAGLQSVDEVVSVDREVMSGAAVFRGTRVPLQTLLDHLESGLSLEAFIEDFPTVPRVSRQSASLNLLERQ